MIRLLLIAAFLFSYHSTAHAFSSSLGVETWSLRGSISDSGAMGFYVEGRYDFPKVSDSSPSQVGLAYRLSSVNLHPNAATDIYRDDRSTSMTLWEFGPTYCNAAFAPIAFCGTVGLLAGSIQQSLWTRNDFTAAFVRVGVHLRINPMVFADLDAQAFNARETIAERSTHIKARGVALGLGVSL